MSQTKLQSLKETFSNTSIGMIGSFIITVASSHVIDDKWWAAAVATLGCTIWSISRGYCIRRYFNKQAEKTS